MGYHMEYGTGKDDAVFHRMGNKNSRILIVAVVMAILLVTCYFQKDRIMDFLLPGDPAVTKNAIDVFVSEIKEGERMTNAFASFCKVIVNEAGLS